MFSKIKKYVIGFFVLCGGVLVAFLSGRSAGRKDEKLKGLKKALVSLLRFSIKIFFSQLRLHFSLNYGEQRMPLGNNYRSSNLPRKAERLWMKLNQSPLQ